MLNPKQLEELKQQVQNEYAQGYNHIRSERDRKQDVLEKVLPLNIPEGEVKIHLLWRNIQLENSLFLTDELNVVFNSDDGVLSREVMHNANLVAKYDWQDMDLYEMQEDIVNHNGLYGASITVIDGYDTDEEQPISTAIDPMCVIPDPKNWRGSKMRFIGFERKVTKSYLENLGFKNIDKLTESVSIEQQKYERKFDNANNTNYVSEQKGLYNIYDHFTTFDGKKYLTSWGNERTELTRIIELEPLTEAERKKPNKIKYPVQIHRRKPIYGRFFGASIADEILQYQDSISILVNLQNLQARLAALGPDKYIDVRLGVNLDQLSEHKPGGRIIPADGKYVGNMANGIYTDVQPNPSQFPTQFKGELYKLAEETTGVNSLAFGQSMPGSQTKGEVQTLMQNANQLLSWISTNYLRGLKDYWEAHYKSYALNMPKKAKKVVAFYQNGSSIAKTLTRNDFVSDGKVQVYVESKSQEKLKDEKDFAKLVSIANLYMQNMRPGYALNEFLRKIGDKLGVDGFDSKKYIIESIDEMKAKANLDLLNMDIDISDPEAGEDFFTYISIYRQALDTPAKAKALEKYERAYIETGAAAADAMAGGAMKPDGITSSMAMNSVNQELSNKNPSVSQVSF